jgi:MFS family permease
MNATASQVGVLYALTNLLPSLIQLKAPSLIEKFSRKQIVTTIISLRLFLWIPIFLSAFLFYLGVPNMVWATILFIGLSYGIMAIGYPVWFSWIGSLVPENQRGHYFSKRNRVVSFVGIITLVSGAILLDYFKKLGVRFGDPIGFTLMGFGILFLFAVISRIWSLKLLRKHYEPRLKIRKKDEFSFKSFIKRAPETPFGRFSIFRGFFSIALGISGPFWAVYILRNLGFSYVWFMSILVSGILFQMIFLPVLGKFSDRFGNVRLMKLCATLISLTPLLWFFSSLISNPFMLKAYLLFVPSLIGGFGWAGYNLATNNYIYDSVGPRKRCFGTSYLNLIVGVGTFVGAGIGSLLVLFDFQVMEPILVIFLLSWILRTFVVVFGLKYLKEVRHVNRYSSQFFIREFEPMRGAVREVHHLNHLVKKVEHYI